ncbi:general transcription factor II-I repeat domain-containing protein 2A [Trichonephila clavipes]|nr:general transcription factor II-I repeat domain-containing protein 2A [Trichonephila clavipes]
MWKTPELAPPLLTTTPHQREDVSALDIFNVHRCSTRWAFCGTGLELVTKPATIRYLAQSATTATLFNMASSTKEQNLQDSKCSREFQTWWAEKYGMINKGDKAVCVLCSGTVALFDDFDNKDKIIQRIKDVPQSRNTMKDRILKLVENVTDQQKNDIKCLDKSIAITKSARLAAFARYCVGNIIKE